VKAGVREFRLGFHSGRTQDLHIRRASNEILEQSRLPHPRLTTENEDAAPRGADPVEERAELSALGIPPIKHETIVVLDERRAYTRVSRLVDCGRSLLDEAHGHPDRATTTSKDPHSE
jgi:hypothetical protein